MGLAHVQDAPGDDGELLLIVRRPRTDERETPAEGVLDTGSGLVGDDWVTRPDRRSADGGPHLPVQVTIMNSRVLDVMAGPVERWPLAGDQLYVDFDISESNLPAGSRLAVGESVVEVTEEPHTGCAKFVQRFGADAQRWVNSPTGRSLRLRGVNTRVVRSGTVRVGDRVSKV